VTDPVREAIASYTAAVERVNDAPDAVGYGSDVSCVTDVDADWTELDPYSGTCIQQAVLRRWITTLGENPDDPTYGAGAHALLAVGATTATLSNVRTKLENEALQDDRVLAIEVEIDQVGSTEFEIFGPITPSDPSVNVPDLTLAITNGKLALERIST